MKETGKKIWIVAVVAVVSLTAGLAVPLMIQGAWQAPVLFLVRLGLPALTLWRLQVHHWQLGGPGRATLAAGTLITLNTLLLGLPGFGFLLLVSLFSPHSLREVQGDAAWAVALVSGGLWPLGIPVAYLLVFRGLPRLPRMARGALLAALVIGWAGLVGHYYFEEALRAGR